MDSLFERNQIVGVFKGFTEGGLEFHADLVLPYQSDFNNIPMHGQFLMIQLETPDEAVLGRITSVSSDGKLSYGSGEEYNLRAIKENRTIPEDLREQYLKYRVNIRVLGGIKTTGNNIRFVPSQRRIPHVGSPVAFPSDEILTELAGGNEEGTPIGVFALGEYIFAGSDGSGIGQPLDWMQLRDPKILVKFPVNSLVSRRSFVFARAGFGKSNLNKLLFSRLYQTTPTVEKRNGKQVPVGTIIFDRDGEYFWPDDKGRPGLCDVPKLKNQLVVFTSRKAPSPFYSSFVAGGIKLDIRGFRPSDIIAISLSQEKQDQQNVRKLKGLNHERWGRLVDLIARDRNDASLEDIKEILNLDKTQGDVEAIAARSNMTVIVSSLHDPSSQFVEMLLMALSEGKLCIVDASQLRGEQAFILSGIILKRIFDRNQEQFTAADPQTIPTIAVIEEAQSVLVPNAPAAEPYIAWVKEGRKYDLGALMITQQPGSIPTDILSQGDNWFIFHLLSGADLQNVKRANAHFSDDILSSLLNEPIPGQGVMWSSVSSKPYPISLRVLSFEAENTTYDKDYNRPAENIYATQLKEKFNRELSVFSENGEIACKDAELSEEMVDVQEIILQKVVDKIRADKSIMDGLKTGMPWGRFMEPIKEALPSTIMDADKQQVAYNLVKKVLDKLSVSGGGWETYKENTNGKPVTFIKLKGEAVN